VMLVCNFVMSTKVDRCFHTNDIQLFKSNKGNLGINTIFLSLGMSCHIHVSMLFGVFG